MAIVVPDQGNVELAQGRGSSIQSTDNYVRPAMQQDNGSADQLTAALNKFGANLTNIGDERKSAADAADLKNVDYHKSIVGEIKDGTAVQAQIDKTLVGKSAIVRGRVAEMYGIEDGTKYAQAEMLRLAGDPLLKNNPEAYAAALKQIEVDATAKVAGQPAYGAGYLKAISQYNGAAGEVAAAERTKKWGEEQKKNLGWRVVDDAEANKGKSLGFKTVAEASQGRTVAETFPSLSGILVAGKPDSSLGNLNATLAKRTDTMLSEAPPEIQAQLKIISGYRSTSHQAELYNAALAKYGSPESARKWVAPPGSSNHNHGEAIDFGGGGALKNTPAGKWLHANADKFGLYFPMKNEPWHIEMIGGRRQGGHASQPGFGIDGPKNTEAHSPADGHDDISHTDLRVSKIIGIESSDNPNAQNTSSSAGGLGGYTDGTWMESLRRHRPDLTTGKTDDQLVALKRDPALAKDIVGKDVAVYEKRLAQIGAENTDGNVWLMHFSGSGAGPKVVKANDATKVDTLYSAKAMEANPWLKGMTIGELKQHAEEKMGGAVGADAHGRNMIRGRDREFSITSSLNNIDRREAVSSTLLTQAIRTNDASWLTRMPPELHSMETRASFQQAQRQIDEHIRTEAVHAQAKKDRDEQNERTGLMEGGFQKLAKGEEININEAARRKDGMIDPTVASYLRTQKLLDMTVDPFASARTASDLTEAVAMASSTGNYGNLVPGKAAGELMTKKEIEDLVAKHPGLTSTDRIALFKSVEKTMNQYTAMRDPEFGEVYNHTVGAALKATMEHPVVKAVSPIMMLGLNENTRGVYDATLRRGWKNYGNEHNNEIPVGEAREKIIKEAVEAAKVYLGNATSNLVNQKPASSQASILDVTPTSTATAKTNADGSVVIERPAAATPAAPVVTSVAAQVAPMAEQAVNPAASPATPASTNSNSLDGQSLAERTAAKDVAAKTNKSALYEGVKMAATTVQQFFKNLQDNNTASSYERSTFAIAKDFINSTQVLKQEVQDMVTDIAQKTENVRQGKSTHEQVNDAQNKLAIYMENTRQLLIKNGWTKPINVVNHTPDQPKGRSDYLKAMDKLNDDATSKGMKDALTGPAKAAALAAATKKLNDARATLKESEPGNKTAAKKAYKDALSEFNNLD